MEKVMVSDEQAGKAAKSILGRLEKKMFMEDFMDRDGAYTFMTPSQRKDTIMKIELLKMITGA